jgi:hypothetical protein
MPEMTRVEAAATLATCLIRREGMGVLVRETG